ncbi:MULTISPECIES: fumarate reductase cytochrome b subunit [Shewanella]|uniref:fumarate reductase cytochrome b subunit n=1 Tax=Shewanella TaxID=22 RepID=UPI001C65EB37|nr:MULTISPECIES: fumarate reductase cytochrome b subunit [Shewanella]QYJ74970.1 fumarate reductase cytochrome b subunit [Shewanella sp. FJAT-52076]QYK04841.1 fumarate reductase cytochrome b subunit [Shewanella zhangzhouensis]
MAGKLDIRRWSGVLDLGQSVSGVVLALFLWTHLLLVSSILLGPEAMTWVARNMELAFLSDDGHGYPWVVSLIAIGVAALAAFHVLVAIHKLPLTLRQQKALKSQMQVINHSDTRLWSWQAGTGIVILMLLPVHLWLVGSAPETIGPVGSAQRIWGEYGYLIYLPLLLTVELHAAIGLYRVALKWGAARDLNTRARLRTIKTVLSVLFVGIGLAALLAFIPHTPV